MSKKKANLNSKQAIALISVGLFIVICSFRLEPPAFEQLEKVTGYVDEIEFISSGRNSKAKLRILLLKSDYSQIELKMNLIEGWYTRWERIKKDQMIEALVSRDGLFRGFYWMWELRHYNDTVYSYKETYEEDTGLYQRLKFAGFGFILFGIYRYSKSQKTT